MVAGSQAAFKGLSSLFTHLPTGTVFLFQFLSPILTNNGRCRPVNKILSSSFIFLCSLSCLLFAVSDSFTDSDGNKVFGIATRTGMWLGSRAVARDDLYEYRLRAGDLVHASFSLIVFGAVALLDSNMVNCFYPEFQSTQGMLVIVIPTLIGAISGIVFVMFPNKRHRLRLKQKAGGAWTVESEETQAPEMKKEEHTPAQGVAFHEPEEQTPSISYFVTNFPEHMTAKDLWIIFTRCIGPVVDVTIPGARTKRGARFAYIRFPVRSLDEELECARRISCAWWGGYKLVVCPARSQRYTDHYHPMLITCPAEPPPPVNHAASSNSRLQPPAHQLSEVRVER